MSNHPNIPDNDHGDTPIHEAAIHGHTEIVKILAQLTVNPNAPDEHGKTPIHSAAWKGHTEIVKILASLTDNPNVPDNNGRTPIYKAAWKGHTEIVKILASLTDNPDTPNSNGKTPSSVTKKAEIRRILKSFNTSRKHKAGPPTKPSTK